jgi:biotin synthase-like enzyme
LNKEEVEEVARDLCARGQILLAGWIAYKHLVVGQHAPAPQLEIARMAFYAGAQHLFGTLLALLDPDAEPTERDLHMMQSVNSELEAYLATFKAKHDL